MTVREYIKNEDKVKEYCCEGLKDAHIRFGIVFYKNGEFNFTSHVTPTKAGNVITGEELDPKNFIITMVLNYCPFCGHDFQKKPNEDEMKAIDQRNLKRMEDLQKTGRVFCPQIENDIEPMKCMFCPCGHMTECHFPYDCNSGYCHHYPPKSKL